MPMSTPAVRGGVALVAAALAIAGASATSDASPRGARPAAACLVEPAAVDESSPRADCCFTHRSYSGVCVVKPEERETCASILAYLNDPQSQGKGYCGRTNVRGGWQQVSCQADPAAPGGSGSS